MTNREWVRVHSRVVAGLLAVAASVACGNEHVTNVVASPRTVAAAAELTFTNVQRTDATARLVLGSSLTKLAQLDAGNDTTGDFTGLSVALVAVSDFIFTPADSAPTRFIRATFAVKNAGTGKPLFEPARDNLTFVAVVTPNTVPGTAVRRVLLADGTSLPAAFAQQIAPTDLIAVNGNGALTTLPPPVMVTLSDTVRTSIPLPSDATSLLSYGFLVRGVADFNGQVQVAVPADGLVTFAFRLPKEAATTNDAATLSLLFLLVNDPNSSGAQ